MWGNQPIALRRGAHFTRFLHHLLHTLRVISLPHRLARSRGSDNNGRRRENKMARGVISVGSVLIRKRIGCEVSCLTAFMTAWESVGLFPLSISTTPSCVRMIVQLDSPGLPA